MSKSAEGSSGGAAGAAGFFFQSLIGARLAARILAEESIGSLFDLPISCIPSIVRFETEYDVDDLFLECKDRQRVYIQAKTTLPFSKAPDSVLASVFKQFAHQWKSVVSGEFTEDYRLSLVVSKRAASSITVTLSGLFKDARSATDFDHLKSICDASEKKKHALETAASHIRGAFSSQHISNADVLAVLQRCCVTSMEEASNSSDYDFEVAALKEKVLDSEQDMSATAWETLQNVCLNMCSARSGGNLRVFRDQLESKGIKTKAPPSFQNDIQRLNLETARNRQAEDQKKGVLTGSSSGFVSVPRTNFEEILGALEDNGVFLTGGPGFGKTALQLQIADRWQDMGRDIVFLSVDRYPVDTEDELRLALECKHSLRSIFENWQSQEPGLILIDALDAARGQKAESVYRNLIADILNITPSRWRICASIRTFDLENSHIFQRLSAHFKAIEVVEFQDQELDILKQKSPVISSVLDAASSSTAATELLKVPFNLQLAAEVVTSEQGFNRDIGRVSTQATLLAMYWRARLPTRALRDAVEKVADQMVAAERLSIRTSDLSNCSAEEIDGLLHSAILLQDASGNSKVRFRHHILFDYAVSKAQFDAEELGVLSSVLALEGGRGLLLAPAFRFFLHTVWAHDGNRSLFWACIRNVSGKREIDPIARAVAARSVTDLVAEPSDFDGLVAYLREDPDSCMRALLEIVQEALHNDFTFDVAPTDAWLALLRQMIELWGSEQLFVPRLLLLALKKAGASATEGTTEFVSVAASFYDFVFRKEDAERLSFPDATVAIESLIEFSAAARQCDQLVARVPLLFQYSKDNDIEHELVPTLCRYLPKMVSSAPELSASIYRRVFEIEPPSSDEETYLGNSQILSLRSNKKQDFENCYYSLGKAFPGLWEASVEAAVQAAIAAAESHCRYREVIGSEPQRWEFETNAKKYFLREDQSFIWASDPESNLYGIHGGDVLKAFSSQLQKADPKILISALRAITDFDELPGLIWARFLWAANFKPAETEALASSFLFQSCFFECADTVHDATELLSSYWVLWPEEKRIAFESSVLKTFPEAASRHALSGLPVSDLTVLQKEKQKQMDEGRDAKTQRTEFITRSSDYDWARDDGVDVDSGINANLRSAIEVFQKSMSLAEDISACYEILAKFEQEIAAADSQDVDWHISCEAWDALYDECLKLIERPSFSYAPDDIAISLNTLVLRGAEHERPEADTVRTLDGRATMSWGRPAPRLVAAQALMELIRVSSRISEETIQAVRTLLHDSVATVRLQVAMRLNALWTADRNLMWELIEKVLEQEQSRGVVAFLVNGPLARIAGSEVARVGQLCIRALEREWDDPGDDDKLDQHCSSLLSGLWIWRGWKPAQTIMDQWLDDIEEHESSISQVTFLCRSSITNGLPDPAQDDVRERSQQYLLRVAKRCSSILLEYYFKDKNRVIENDKQASQAAAKCLDRVATEIFFGSGAFENSKKTNPLPTRSAQRVFWSEISPILAEIAKSATPHTIHELLKILLHFLDVEPKQCIELMFAALLDGPNKEQYASEQMGSDQFVKLIRRALSDHKEILRESELRQKLLSTIDLFIVHGSTDARRLIHELPDALR